MDDIDIMTILEAEGGDLEAGFRMFRKMLEAAAGDYVPNEYEREYFRRCIAKLTAQRYPKNDSKKVQRLIARCLNLTRLRGGQRSNIINKIGVASAIRRLMLEGHSQKHAVNLLLEQRPEALKLVYGQSVENLKRISQGFKNSMIVEALKEGSSQ